MAHKKAFRRLRRLRRPKITASQTRSLPIALPLSLSPSIHPPFLRRQSVASEHLDRINASRASLSLLPPLHQRPLSRPRNPVASLGSDIQIEMPAARTCFSLCIVCITIAPHVFLLHLPCSLFLCLCCFLLVPLLVVPAGQVALCVHLRLLGRELQPHATLAALGGLRAPRDAPVVLKLAA